MASVPINRARPLPVDLAKTLPTNLDAERAVLGAVLLDNSVLSRIAEKLLPSDFFLSQHSRIFLAMMALSELQSPIDLVTLSEKLHADKALETAGGAPYLASLADGMPRVSNVGHYAAIVKDKSRARYLIHLTNNVQQKALEGDAKVDELWNELAAAERESSSVKENPGVVVGWHEILTLDIPEPEFVIYPLLTVGGSMMVYSWAGVGKSFVTTELAVALALGESKVFNLWPIKRRYRVLYIYGEMHGGEIKLRFRQLIDGHKVKPEEGDDSLGFMAKEYQRIKRASRHAYDWRPSIFAPSDRRIVEDLIAGGRYEIVVLDNISTLWPSSQEASSDRDAILKNWFIDLNQNGTSVISLTHAGKGGDFLGDSSQIHILDSVLRLRRPPGDYSREQQLRAEVKIEKLRHSCSDARLMQEFELSLQTGDAGAEWLYRTTKDVQFKTAFGMFTDGMKEMQVFQSMGGDPSLRTIYRWKRKYLENSDPTAHAEGRGG